MIMIRSRPDLLLTEPDIRSLRVQGDLEFWKSQPSSWVSDLHLFLVSTLLRLCWWRYFVDP